MLLLFLIALRIGTLLALVVLIVTVLLPVASIVLGRRIQVAVCLDGRVHLTGSGAIAVCGPVRRLSVLLRAVVVLLALVVRARLVLGFLTALLVFDVALGWGVVVVHTHRVLGDSALTRDGSGSGSGDDSQKRDDKELGHLGSRSDEVIDEMGGHRCYALEARWTRCRSPNAFKATESTGF
jgi:hypothetical protein